jgi:nitroreductase
MMDFKELVEKNRSYRRFHQNYDISLESLRELVDLARLTPSAANRQPLRYILSNKSDRNAVIFQHLAWAAYLADWGGPAEGERPSAYIIVLLDKNITSSSGCDHGIAAQTILLGATARGLGGCMLASVKKEGLMNALNISSDYEVLLVIALGKPKEVVVIESIGPAGDIKYWRDESGVHHVPKRSLDDLVLEL